MIVLLAQNTMPQVTCSLITAVQDSCRNGLLDWSPRLKLAMYTRDIYVSSKSTLRHRRLLLNVFTDVLGNIYGVVSRQRGRIVAEERTSFFAVTAMLPVIESSGFADGKVTD